MATQWYESSITPEITDWDDVAGASTVGSAKQISSGGAIFTELTESRGKVASNYVQIKLKYSLQLTSDFNYQNKIYVVLAGTFKNGTNLEKFKMTIAVNQYNKTDVDSARFCVMDVDMQGLPLENFAVYVMNNSTETIDVYLCEIRKSIDNNVQQVNSQLQSFLAGNKLLEVDTRTDNKLKITYENGEITYDWYDDTSNHVITLTHDQDQILLKY